MSEDQYVEPSLIRLYILHRAADQPVDSETLVDTLEDYGLKRSVRSIAQILLGLERMGLLESDTLPGDNRRQKTYRATQPGRLAARQARNRIRQLCGMSPPFGVRG